MQKLPIGEQFFSRLREKNLLYVDKTQQIDECRRLDLSVAPAPLWQIIAHDNAEGNLSR